MLVVNDGSTDDTVEVSRDRIALFESVASLQVLENPTRRGKGYSVRHGVLKSTGHQVLFTDADCSKPILIDIFMPES